jgi:hypothetical protein
MQCERCHDIIPDGEQKELHDRILCEDCYMDLLSPPKACDPWAVYSAQSLAKQDGHELKLSPLQMQILALLRERGPMEPKGLSEIRQVKETDLERELAALRHMERVRGQLTGGRRVIRLWD